MFQAAEQLRPNGQTAEPLASVRVGRRLASARLPRGLEALRAAAKRLTWTLVEARLVTTPLRYARYELTGHATGEYVLHGSASRITVRHRSGDIDILRKFLAYGYYEIPGPVMLALQALGRPVNVLDLGANIGLFEVYTRDRLEIGHVVCFEPDPSNGAILERTRAANAADWEIVPACASNRDGQAHFNTGRKNFSRIGADGDLTVETKDVFPVIAEADLVKMNIEGSEWDVLEDPRMADTSVSWIIEYHRIANPEDDIHGLARRLLERVGYTVQLVRGNDSNGLLWAWRA